MYSSADHALEAYFVRAKLRRIEDPVQSRTALLLAFSPAHIHLGSADEETRMIWEMALDRAERQIEASTREEESR